jgi:1-acyl-sn-glycerol-3-phosphate acyltransferase
LFYWILKYFAVGPLLRVVFRPWVEGEDNVPSEGPAILASNHLSFSDSFFMPLVIERRVTFLAKSDYFHGRGIKGRLTAGFFKGVGQLPVDRSGGRASEAALTTGLKVLSEGRLLGIYPEGTRSPDGRLYRGKTGVARMALEGKVPVIPVAMIGTDKVQPIGKRLPRIGRVGVRFGKPIDFSRYEGMEGDRFILRSVTDQIMYELMDLAGQEYVDIYAAKAKADLAEAKRKAKASAAAEAAATSGVGEASADDGSVDQASAFFDEDDEDDEDEGPTKDVPAA